MVCAILRWYLIAIVLSNVNGMLVQSSLSNFILQAAHHTRSVLLYVIRFPLYLSLDSLITFHLLLCPTPSQSWLLAFFYQPLCRQPPLRRGVVLGPSVHGNPAVFLSTMREGTTRQPASASSEGSLRPLTLASCHPQTGSIRNKLQFYLDKKIKIENNKYKCD